MSKTTQTIGGPPTAPSPGLSQTAFPSAPTAPVVFGPPQPPQMNTQSQPRQAGFRSIQHYYPSRTQPPTSATRVQSGSSARAVTPAHVYQPGSQVMMIPSQISYPSQGYYIQGQGRSYVVPTNQYPVQTGAPGFFPSASPSEYGTYAGAYYPAQQTFPPGVPGAQVMMNQPQVIPPKRERKTIRIRDPNQGGKDITEEILSGGRTTSTPTPPQSTVGSSEVQANGESVHHVTVVVRPDDGSKATQVLIKASESPSPPLPLSEAEPSVENVCDIPTDNTISELTSQIVEPLDSEEATLDTSTPQVDLQPVVAVTEDVTHVEEASPQETVFAEALVTQSETPKSLASQPLAEESTPQQIFKLDTQVPPLQQEVLLTETVELELGSQAIPPPHIPEPETLEPEVPASDPLHEEISTEPTVSTEEPQANGLSEETPVLLVQPQPTSVCQTEPSLESPIAQPEELLLTNGDGSPGLQENDTPDSKVEAHVSPITEPEDQPVTVSDNPLVEEEVEKPLPTDTEVVASTQVVKQSSESQSQVAVAAPKKKRKMKDLNKKEAVGDLLDAFKEAADGSSDVDSSKPTSAAPEPDQSPCAPPEEQDETWEEKEDKLDAENIKPGEYKYKEEQWKPLNPEDKKSYDREFLLGFQFIVASMQKPAGLPQITDVVLDKANKAPLRPLDPTRLTGMNCGPDFTPSFANLGRPAVGNRGPPAGMGPRRSQQGPRKEPRKIIQAISLNENVQLNKAEKAWKPLNKRSGDEEDPENIKTQELFRRVRSILNKLTPQMFQQLMKQVTDLSIDTEDRLKGVIDLIFEKAISEPNFSVAYANMCRCLMGLKVSTTDKPGVTVNFRKLLLNRCQKEFEKDKDDDEVFEKKQKELDAAASPEEKTRLNEELTEARNSARRRSLGNIKFIGELFKLKMLTEAIMHDCVVKLLKNHDEESLECLCRLLSTIGKDLDFERAKPRMDQYFNQMDKIIKERKTSSRIRFMLQDLIDLRLCNWVPRRADQGPKTIDQIHKDAEMEKQREQVKVQQLMSKPDKRREPPGRPTGGRGNQQGDDGWNTVPISKSSRPIDTTRITKITKLGAIDSNQLLAPGGRLSWGKGSSGGTGAKPAETAPESSRPATSTLNRFSALQQSSSAESQDARRPLQRGSSSRERSDKDRGDRFERGERFDKGEMFERSDRSDRARPLLTKRSYSKETEDRSREREARVPQEAVRKVASMTEQRDRSKESTKREIPAPTATVASSKPSMSEDELEKKSKAIIEEYLHINDMKEALQCVVELNSPTLLFIFVRNGIESTLERSTIAREHMGLLLYQLVKAGTLSREQYYKGMLEVLEVGEDMEIDIPHIWLYLAEIISPVLLEGGILMGELFRELTKPLVLIGKAGILLAEILGLLCKGMSHKKAGALWKESGLSWKEFLSKDQDINTFITEKKLEYTTGDETETPCQKELSPAELDNILTKLLKENSSNQKIFDWIEANFNDQESSSNTFVRTLMSTVCHSAIIFENPCRVDVNIIHARAKLLQKYLSDEAKELQALYALQALVVKLDQPPNLLRMFFDALYDEDVIKEEPFYKWESSKDPAEQQGKGVALKSVTAFFTWLREAEDESDN
ncbi:eukaryotic translation initiation factor 4 gamma 1 isoform X1 [Xenopus laevis]|uniref:Eukaryotic Translation initiation factor 4 gamma 1 isoform X1 n=2 Tax=Xenopus laevis TaxID=8355 RepID=A0A8J0V8H5_XENLA|nr:eukaryotic translation initiation factor 4 gamma 1 isoform X1 [Xenopus laevis]XP_018119031.1 eukaryotic translation initiation factor 4 gamma 1 isoform X1 [Xenopus laevis]XP_018119032.1 eukaryotic translation initiation factor 4 gamma 1 isoform X1 [Xenopus laevis]XP_018119033.1 eukaryotic translation initiation factor 4 gamma 1 isoform X1 [Xenopus laevis]XP_041419142.1 eukaryotic translation initiation factor 4 gamma 1 isoform X1 [Xenopus laevis]